MEFSRLFQTICITSRDSSDKVRGAEKTSMQLSVAREANPNGLEFLNCKTGLESKARSVRERSLKRRRIEITAFRRVTTVVSEERIKDSVDSTAQSANQLRTM